MPERCHFCDGEKRITHEVRQKRETVGRYCSGECAYADTAGPALRRGKCRIVWVGGNRGK